MIITRSFPDTIIARPISNDIASLQPNFSMRCGLQCNIILRHKKVRLAINTAFRNYSTAAWNSCHSFTKSLIRRILTAIASSVITVRSYPRHIRRRNIVICVNKLVFFMQRGRLGRRYLQQYSAKRHNDGSSNADNFWYKPLISLMNLHFPLTVCVLLHLAYILANKNVNANVTDHENSPLSWSKVVTLLILNKGLFFSCTVSNYYFNLLFLGSLSKPPAFNPANSRARSNRCTYSLDVPD